jgi:hypothetical protein
MSCVLQYFHYRARTSIYLKFRPSIGYKMSKTYVKYFKYGKDKLLVFLTATPRKVKVNVKVKLYVCFL